MTPTAVPNLDLLLVSERPIWPWHNGVNVRGFHMVRHLPARGMSVRLASLTPMPPDAPPWLRERALPWPCPARDDLDNLRRAWAGPLARLRYRLARHQGLDPARIAGIGRLVRETRPAVVLGLGLHSPLLLAALRRPAPGGGPRRVFYAADELIGYHASCCLRQPRAYLMGQWREALLHGLLELAFVRGLDGAIGVSPADTRLFRRLVGLPDAVTIRNGVDLDYFRPAAPPPDRPAPARSVVFWGRLDFAPNLDAVRWFARHVWPALAQRWPDAQWRILGPHAPQEIQRLAHLPGVRVLGEAPDIRPVVAAAAVAVLPVRCGAGIKNKLLEAAAMGRPIVASPAAVAGLEVDPGQTPWLVCTKPADWAAAIQRLWSDRVQAERLSRNARLWVQRHHDWADAAAHLHQWLNRLSGRTLGRPAPADSAAPAPRLARAA